MWARPCISLAGETDCPNHTDQHLQTIDRPAPSAGFDTVPVPNMSPAGLFSSITQGIRVTAEVDKVAAMPENSPAGDIFGTGTVSNPADGAGRSIVCRC